MPESDTSEHDRRHATQGLGSVLKIVAGIAGLVCLMAPITDMGILASIIALIVAIITGVLGVHLSDDKGHSGYWPKDPGAHDSL